MANSTLSNLTATTALTSGDLLYVVDGGNSRKIDWDDVVAQLFNDVTVENSLTVNGTTTHNGTQNITGQINVDNLRLDGNTVSVTDANGNLALAPNGIGILDVYGDASIRKGNYQDVSLTIANGTATVGNKREILFTDQAGTTAYIRAYGSGQGSGLNNVLQFGSTTNYFNLTPSGNIAFPSGQGIDFSATSGTGTSELFDDYEEGTFTPSFTNLTVGDGSVFGRYTKIGRIVNVELGFTYGSTSSISGNIGDITGLPFTSVSINSNVSQLAVGSVFKPGVGWFSIVSNLQSNSSNLLVTRDFSNTAITPTTPTVFASGTTLTISIQYEAA